MGSWVQEEESRGKDGSTSVASRVVAKSMTEEEESAWGRHTEACQVEQIQLCTSIQEGGSLDTLGAEPQYGTGRLGGS